ncbi:MAG: DUF3373 domain-containing protein [Sulfurovum sp.]|nr:DUF3373 domain-containing protein [Sulfurovum sp.]
MNKIVKISLITAMALATVNASSLSAKLSTLETELADLKKQVKKQNKKLNKVKAHDANDNIKWGVDLRTGIDNINYDLANGKSVGKNDLMSMRLWLNMEFAADTQNIFKGQLSMNKAFGADFGSPVNRNFSLGGQFDWTGNEALTNNTLKVRQAYWLYLGDSLFGADIPWTFSVGRRPSTNGFLANLRDDDGAASPLAHVINVEFDGLSSKLDLSNITGIPGMSIKLCMGQGSTNAQPLFESATPYVNGDSSGLDDIKLAGFIFEPYNDGQFIVKSTWYKAFDLPGMDMDMMDNPMAGQPGQPLQIPVLDAKGKFTYAPTGFKQYGDMQGAALSVLVDGLTEEGYFSDAKVFGSFAWSKTQPETRSSMLGSTESETGTSYWLGAQLPVTDSGTLGLEFNHGSQYWRPFTYAEDTMIGSKIAARGDAFEAYFTYQITDALSAQVRYTKIDYEYTGSNGFFGNYSGGSNKISDMKDGAAGWDQMSTALGRTLDPRNPQDIGAVAGALAQKYKEKAGAVAGKMAGAKAFLPNVVESAQDLRFYIRYRF